MSTSKIVVRRWGGVGWGEYPAAHVDRMGEIVKKIFIPLYF
jgi:hypothetical protein